LIALPDINVLLALPALSASSFDALVPKIMGYRQVSDATLPHLARVYGLKLTTFDRPVAAVCPWGDNTVQRRFSIFADHSGCFRPLQVGAPQANYRCATNAWFIGLRRGCVPNA
jgi:hypothetical protein